MSAEAVDSSDVQALKEQLLTRSKALFTSNDLWVIAVALNLAQAAHEGQQRKHGAAYLTHPLRVALILLDEFQVRQAVAIAAALLHDVLEDAADRCGRGNIEAMCGPEVAGCWRFLTAPPKSAFPNKADPKPRKGEQGVGGADDRVANQTRRPCRQRARCLLPSIAPLAASSSVPATITRPRPTTSPWPSVWGPARSALSGQRPGEAPGTADHGRTHPNPMPGGGDRARPDSYVPAARCRRALPWVADAGDRRNGCRRAWRESQLR